MIARNAYLILLVCVLAGCGRFQPVPFIDQELRPYHDAFVEDAASLGVHLDDRHLSMFFADLDQPVVGQCGVETESQPGYSFTKYRVRIDRTFWASASEDEKVVVIYHELGHCWLDRGHSSPKSIMEPYLIWDFAGNENYYIKELFGKIERLNLQKSQQYLPKLGSVEGYCDHSTDSADH